LFVANYGGSFATFKISKSEDGSILERIYLEDYGQGSGIVGDRQEYSHAHGISLWNDYVFVIDLGSDKIWHYKIHQDSTTSSYIIKKALPEYTKTAPGFGPRHMAICRDFAYVIYELQSKIGIFNIDPKSGTLLEHRGGQVDIMEKEVLGN
jgi:6-phosphogluconolactonase (cycloisomerase 2 family)